MAVHRKPIPDDVTAADKVTSSASARPTVTPKAKLGLDPLLTNRPTPSTAPVIPKRHMLGLQSDPSVAEISIPVIDPAQDEADLAASADDGFRPLEVVRTKALSAELAASADQPSDRLDAQQPDSVAVPAVESMPEDTPEEIKPEPDQPDEPVPVDKTEVATAPANKSSSEPTERSARAQTEPLSDEADKNEKPAVKSAVTDEPDQQAKLNQLISAQTYFVPINAVARRRSHIVTVILILLALVLLAALVDLLLDIGILKLNLPHTRFFQS